VFATGLETVPPDPPDPTDPVEPTHPIDPIEPTNNGHNRHITTLSLAGAGSTLNCNCCFAGQRSVGILGWGWHLQSEYVNACVKGARTDATPFWQL